MKNKGQALNELIISYQQTKDVSTFDEIFDVCEVMIQVMKKKYRKLDADDIEGMAGEKLANLISKFDADKGDFENLYFRSIKFGCYDLLRTHQRKKENETDDFVAQPDGGISNIFEEVFIESATANAEDEIITSLQKKNDQRKLIAFLYKQANENCRQAMIAYFDEDNDTDTAAAKQIGVSDKTINNRLRAVARNFDVAKHGHHYDYYTA